MCRLLGLRAAAPVPLFRLLIAGDNSFAVQSLEHPDGWGMAHYAEREPAVIKSILPAICDELFEEASLSVVAPTVLAHIRRATAGRVAPENCHPFSHGRWTFAHNGHIQGIEHLRDELIALVAPELRAGIGGQTDSEVYFVLFLTALARRGAIEHATGDDVRAALAWAVATVRRVASAPGPTGEPTRLTCLVSDGELMVGLNAGRTLAVRAVPGDGDRAAMVLFSSESISVKGQPVCPTAAEELGYEELAVVTRELDLTRAAL